MAGGRMPGVSSGFRLQNNFCPIIKHNSVDNITTCVKPIKNVIVMLKLLRNDTRLFLLLENYMLPSRGLVRNPDEAPGSPQEQQWRTSFFRRNPNSFDFNSRKRKQKSREKEFCFCFLKTCGRYLLYI